MKFGDARDVVWQHNHTSVPLSVRPIVIRINANQDDEVDTHDKAADVLGSSEILLVFNRWGP